MSNSRHDASDSREWLDLNTPRVLPLSWPSVLQKACCDKYEYVMGLSDGTRVAFTQAYVVNDNWVRVDIVKVEMCDDHFMGRQRPHMATQRSDRHTEFNVSRILWVADGAWLDPS